MTGQPIDRKLAEIIACPGVFSEFEVRLAREAQEALRAQEARIEALRQAIRSGINDLDTAGDRYASEDYDGFDREFDATRDALCRALDQDNTARGDQ